MNRSNSRQLRINESLYINFEKSKFSIQFSNEKHWKCYLISKLKGFWLARAFWYKWLTFDIIYSSFKANEFLQLQSIVSSLLGLFSSYVIGFIGSHAIMSVHMLVQDNVDKKVSKKSSKSNFSDVNTLTIFFPFGKSHNRVSETTNCPKCFFDLCGKMWKCHNWINNIGKMPPIMNQNYWFTI